MYCEFVITFVDNNMKFSNILLLSVLYRIILVFYSILFFHSKISDDYFGLRLK